MSIRVGVTGCSIPSALADQFPAAGTHLERYGARFSAVEITSSFYRPHRRTTYARWARNVVPSWPSFPPASPIPETSQNISSTN